MFNNSESWAAPCRRPSARDRLCACGRLDSIPRALRRPEWPQQPQRCSTASRGLRRPTEEGQGRQGLPHVAPPRPPTSASPAPPAGQGLELEASVAVYVNRPHYAKFWMSSSRTRSTGTSPRVPVPRVAQSGWIRTNRKSFSSSYAGSSG